MTDYNTDLFDAYGRPLVILSAVAATLLNTTNLKLMELDSTTLELVNLAQDTFEGCKLASVTFSAGTPAAAEVFKITGRAALTFPCAYVQPTQANQFIAFDIMPKGIPSDYASVGTAWIDICSTDVIAYPATYQSLKLGKFLDNYGYIGCEGPGGVKNLHIAPFGGKVGVGAAFSTTAAPKSLFTVKIGDSGASINAMEAILLESNDDAYIGILVPANKSAGLMFGDPGSALAGMIRYSNTSLWFEFYFEAASRLKYSASLFDFQETTVIRTQTADAGLSLQQAAGKLGFYGATPIVRALLATGAAHTVDDVITALQNLGLVKQS